MAGTASSSSELYEKEWKLLELNGKAVVLDSNFEISAFDVSKGKPHIG
ncbi:hypothetical protein LWM68_09145 [Niabella sp. W65]|nr:hypothetical protein [Niabella sp. W65]MCH7362918.1 hypothetical protein [Niabella sp. W65]ULT38864.1 hypothetical protein KRR40_27830 [Niabella sp. I65]